MSWPFDSFSDSVYVDPVNYDTQRRYVKQFFSKLSWAFFTLFRSYPTKDWKSVFTKVPPVTISNLFTSIPKERGDIYRAYLYIELGLRILQALPESHRNFLWKEEFLFPMDSSSYHGYSRSGFRYEKLKSYEIFVYTIRNNEELHHSIDELMESFQ